MLLRLCCYVYLSKKQEYLVNTQQNHSKDTDRYLHISSFR